MREKACRYVTEATPPVSARPSVMEPTCRRKKSYSNDLIVVCSDYSKLQAMKTARSSDHRQATSAIARNSFKKRVYGTWTSWINAIDDSEVGVCHIGVVK